MPFRTFYAQAMVLTLPDEIEARLTSLAAEQGRDANALVLEAVEKMLDYDQWFREQVQVGLEQIASGATVSDEEAGERIARFFTKG